MRKRRATYADVLAAPENMIAEIIDGELHLQPRPKSQHLRAGSKLGAALDGPFDEGTNGPGGWIILDEPELHLGSDPDVIVPDLAGWRRERMPELPDDAAHFTLTPDWVCEILSPSTAATDRVRKFGIFLREQVGHVWFIDPAPQTLEVFRFERGQYVAACAFAGDTIARAEPFDAVEIDLAALWRR